jgi:hypothetical protein
LTGKFCAQEAAAHIHAAAAIEHINPRLAAITPRITHLIAEVPLRWTGCGNHSGEFEYLTQPQKSLALARKIMAPEAFRVHVKEFVAADLTRKRAWPRA